MNSKKDKKKSKTTTKQTHLTTTYKGTLDIAKSGMGFIIVQGLEQDILVFPTGIISTTIFIYLLWQWSLLGDMMINCYYSIMSVYGWILWAKNSDDHVHVDVSWATKKEWLYGILLFALSLILVTVVYYYKPYIDNQFSMKNVNLGLYHLDWGNWLDVVTTSVFLVGMWFMAKRRIENWLFWIIGDFICIPMMIYKGLGITSVQYLVFTIMAVQGYITWKKSLRKS